MNPDFSGDTMSTMLRVLKKHWGYDAFRPMQAEIIRSVMEGHDTLGLMATGGGKSITFQVPALLINGLTIVVTPLISLMKDQVDNLRAHGITAFFMHSGLTPRENRLILDKCRLGKARVLYVSPEKLQSKSFVGELARLPVKFIVVDEAHCISQWGYDFRPSYLQIISLRRQFPDAPVLALTASATPDVVADIAAQLGFRGGHNVFRLSFNRTNISYVARYCSLKEEQLVHILQRVPGCGIVYVRSRKRAKTLSDTLCAAGITAEFYHAGLLPEEKDERQNRWKDDRTRIMVATTAFGMGIDKPDVRIVVHFDAPTSLEEYYQEAGRAGRDGKESYAVALVSDSDKGVLTRRLNDSFPPKDYIRRIYDCVCVFNNVAIGEGFQLLCEFNFDKFCERYSLQPAPARSALKILTQCGYIEYIEEISTRSRLMVLMNRNELYSLRLDEECERVFQAVLRSYTGIFADYEHVSESLIASGLDLTERTVYENLLKLGRMKVISYVPRKTTPYVLFTRSRDDSRHLVFPVKVYEQRRRQMEERIAAMKRFLFDGSTCRVSTLLRYFSETPENDCGKCDVCRDAARERSASRGSREAAGVDYDAMIAYALGNARSGMTMAELAGYLRIGPEIVAQVLRRLLDDDKVRLDHATGCFHLH